MLFEKLKGVFKKQTDSKPFNGSIDNTILSFRHTLQKSIEWKDLKDVEFAMWAPCEQDSSFSSSPLVSKWTDIYELTKNHWTYLTADILKTLNLIQDETFRLELPEKLQSFAFLTSTNEQAILSLSQEKGIRFHFAQTTSLDHRLSFLDNFQDYCRAWIQWVELNKGEKDADIGFSRWWELMVEATKKSDAIEPIKMAGKIIK
jgi:hypothetical protein